MTANCLCYSHLHNFTFPEFMKSFAERRVSKQAVTELIVKSFNFIRIATLSLFGIVAVLGMSGMATAQSWSQDQQRSINRDRGTNDRHMDRRGSENADRDRNYSGRQSDRYTGNDYNRYDGDRDSDDRNQNRGQSTYYGQGAYRNGYYSTPYQQRSNGSYIVGTILNQVMRSRRH